MRLFVMPIVLMLASSAVASEVTLLQQPVVTRSNDETSITFAVNQQTDVEISILGSDGKVVRHLAAGVLGGANPPPPPLKPGLAQTITWNGKDDLGTPAAGGPFKIRIRAGMSVKFGRMIGGSPYTGSVAVMPYRAPVNGLAVDAEGNCYVKMMSSIGSHGNSGMWPWHLRKFDRNGNYIKTILPYPTSTDPSKTSGFELVIPSDGLTPANQNSLYPVFSLLGNELVSRIVDGRLIFVHSERRQLNHLSLDGSNRIRTVTMWPPDGKLNCPRWLDIQVALSPDGRYAYYSNVAGTPYDGKKPADIDADWPQGRIYRQDLSKADSQPLKFFDLDLPDFQKQPYWMPSAWDKKTAAAGIDTDADGNVLVCDLVNGQIVEISPAGELLSTTKVPWPDKIMVSRKTGELYVVSRKVSRGGLPTATLCKIVGRGASVKTVAELKLAGTIGGAYALDESRETPVMWLAGQAPSSQDGTKLIRVEDRGQTLEVTGDDFLNREANAITFVGYMDVDREAELVYVTRGSGGKVWRFNGETGKGGPLEIKATDIAVGPGGLVYTWGTDGGYHGPVARYTRELEPASLSLTGKHTYGYLYGRAGRGKSVCGFDVDLRGRVFATYGANECHVRAYDERGGLVNFDRKVEVNTRRGTEMVPVAVSGVVGYGGSIRLDNAGNIYVLQHGLPEDHQPPTGYANDEAYGRAVGTIYKFGPAGGELTQATSSVKRAEGALNRYPGCGPISRWRAAGACACTKPRFDVDGFGRLYIPNGITFSVSIRDNADNEIIRFGGYGNFDSQGPQSQVPKPDIPLGWPITAGASDRYVYVGDALNHRIVRADKTFTVESIVPITE